MRVGDIGASSTGAQKQWEYSVREATILVLNIYNCTDLPESYWMVQYNAGFSWKKIGPELPCNISEVPGWHCGFPVPFSRNLTCKAKRHLETKFKRGGNPCPTKDI